MSKMKRVTIYVDGDKWKDVKEVAYQKRVSAGDYLMGLHGDYLRSVVKPKLDSEILDLAEKLKPEHFVGITDAVSFRDEIAEPIPMKEIKIPNGFVDPIQKAASDLGKVIKRSRAEHKKPKKISKQASVCPECRAPAGHRAGCLLGGA